MTTGDTVRTAARGRREGAVPGSARQRREARRPRAAGQGEGLGHVLELREMQASVRRLVSIQDSRAILDELAAAAARVAAGPGAGSGLALVLGRDPDDPDGPDRGGRVLAASAPPAAAEPFARALRHHAGSVLDSGRTIRLAAADLPGGHGRQVLTRAGIGSVALVPVPVEDEPFGVLAAGGPDARVTAPHRLRRLALLADLGGIALANGRRFEAVRREGDRRAELEDAKSRLLRLASHELRGPLAVLRGYVSMLRDGTYAAQPEQLPDVYAILEAKGRQIELMVTQLLEAARLEDGRLGVEPRPIDLRDPVREAFEGIRLVAQPGHALSLEAPDGPVEVMADPARVTTIVANLLDNAVKYSPRGGPVRCTIRREPGIARVDVVDRGLGIAPEDRAVLFTRFGRVETADNRGIEGTGLGLYLSRELAHAQGGTLSVESEAGAGSTFTLTLPLASPPAPGGR